MVTFSPKLIEQLKAFKTGARLEVTGALSYRPFKVSENGKEFTKKEVSIIAKKVEQAPLAKKTQEAA